MEWRAEGAQDYPGGALDTLVRLSKRGRGPKNYRSSDERLMEVICDRVTDDPFIDAQDVRIDVQQGEVTLTGSVHSRQQKHALEDLIADVTGVSNIHNRLRVMMSADIEHRTSGL
jgi:osmotically-inducible protein OsmY